MSDKQRNPHDAVDYIIHNASKFANAKAARVYLEEFRKSKKALLMAQSTAEAANAREQYAYSHAEYLALLDGLREAIEIEEKLKWDIEAARMRVEIWRTEQANNRMQDRSTQ
jgi:hypothetical protein